MARAKQTVRAEARRRYRQTANLPEDEGGEELDPSTAKTAVAVAKPAANQRAAQAPSGRPGFLSAFRGAYHPAHIREDLRALPKLLTSRALLGGLGLVLLGAIVAYAFPRYTGSAFAWELLVLPGSALGPQLVAGFFAPRASYLLGFIVGLFQGLVFTIFITQFSAQLGATEFAADKLGNLLTLSFVTGPVSGTLFAAAAAWYRRFLSLSSPKRPTAGKPTARGAAKPAASKRR